MEKVDISLNNQEGNKCPQLEALLMEAIEEGNPIDGTPEYWKKKRDLVRTLAERKNAKSSRLCGTSKTSIG